MPRKIKTSEVKIDDVSYDAVVETVTKVDEAPTEEPSVGSQEMVANVGGQVEEMVRNVPEQVLVRNVPEQVEDLVRNVAEQVEKKPKKETEKGTCEKCGKTMTMKNLKYAHQAICSGNKDVEIMEVPPQPILVRSDSDFYDENTQTPKPKRKNSNKIIEVISEEEVVEVPAVQKKPKQTRTKKVSEPAVVPSEPVKKSRAVLKAEKYSALAANALP